MSNLKFNPGQIWACIMECREDSASFGIGELFVIGNIDGDIVELRHNLNSEYIMSVPEKILREYCMFVPQNDLEWLAVNVRAWNNWHNGYTSMIKISDAACLKPDGTEGAYTRQQWQNKRYELGLDEEPRHWLKDLPDAGLFIDNAKSVECDSAGKWFIRTGNLCYVNISGIKMPTLNDDERKHSRISIDELREWQGANL